MHPLKGGAHLNRETSAHCSSGDCLVFESLVLGGVGMTCTLGSLEGRQSAISSLAPWSPDRVQKQPSRFPQVLLKQGGVDEADVVDMLPSEKMFGGGRGGSGERWGSQGSLRDSPLQMRVKVHPHSRRCYRMYTEIIT